MKLPRKQRAPPTWEGPSLYLNCAMQLRVNRGSRQWLALMASCTPIMAVTLKTFIPSFTTDCLAISTRYTKAEKEVKNTFSSFLFEAPPLPSTPFLLDLPCFSLVPPSLPPRPSPLGPVFLASYPPLPTSAFGKGTYLSSDLGVCMNWSPSGHLWPASSLPHTASCVAVCEVVRHPSIV